MSTASRRQLHNEVSPLYVLTISISLTCGHEFIGHIVALGASFKPDVTGRPELYASLRIGDKVVSPFTTSCGECQSVIIHMHLVGLN